MGSSNKYSKIHKEASSPPVHQPKYIPITVSVIVDKSFLLLHLRIIFKNTLSLSYLSSIFVFKTLSQ